jgi:hypothetical protein
MQKVLYVGLDVHEGSISATVAEDGRDGAVNFIGTLPNTPAALSKLSKRLAKNGHQLEFCYEAGFCCYGIYRHLISMGQGCTVVATSMIPASLESGLRQTVVILRSWPFFIAPAI